MKLIDLSHRLEPGKQRFKLDLDMIPVAKWIPAYDTGRDDWYVMGDLRMCTHVGTHVESPYHADENGIKANELDVHRFIGMAAILDFTDKKENEEITAAEVAERGKHIKSGDIVLVRTGISKYFGTPDYKRPYFATDAIQILIDKGMKCMGVDCSGIENRLIDSHDVNHHLLFDNGIPLIEDMNNLDLIESDRVFMYAVTLNIDGLDASMLRPVAMDAGDETEEFYLQWFDKAEFVNA